MVSDSKPSPHLSWIRGRLTPWSIQRGFSASSEALLVVLMIEVEAEGRHDDTGFDCARKGRRCSVLVPQPTDSLTKVERLRMPKFEFPPFADIHGRSSIPLTTDLSTPSSTYLETPRPPKVVAQDSSSAR